MPVIEARWDDGYWVVTLPGNRERVCADQAEVVTVVAREAPYSSLRYVFDPASRPAVDPSSRRQTKTPR